MSMSGGHSPEPHEVVVNGASTTFSVKGVSLTVSNFISNGVGAINQRVATFIEQQVQAVCLHF
ncbi:MAG: hypothetical protein KA343_08415 [Nitrosomonas sp.]|nr:hypothetical protein [Nitrosomonas sp.]HQV89576.1 hypothetical protein [Nitrosomonas sp.]